MCNDANSTTPASKVETINIDQTHENDVSGWCLPYTWSLPKKEKRVDKR